MTDFDTAIQLVTDFFNGDKDKLLLWFTTPNPLLGNVTPIAMVEADHSCPKLLKFIQTQLSENKQDILDQAKDRTEGLIDL